MYVETIHVANDVVASIQIVAFFSAQVKVFFAITMAAIRVSQSTGMGPNIAKFKSSANSIFEILEQISKIHASDVLGTTKDNVKCHLTNCKMWYSISPR